MAYLKWLVVTVICITASVDFEINIFSCDLHETLLCGRGRDQADAPVGVATAQAWDRTGALSEKFEGLTVGIDWRFGSLHAIFDEPVEETRFRG
jgi:hypothetical protein